MAEEDTPIVECRTIVSEDDKVMRGVAIPAASKRLEEPGDMSQSYHEIFDTQGYLGEKQEPVEVYYNEGEGRLESDSSLDHPPMSQYLTSKLVADSLMWQQTFRNDSPSSPEDAADHSPVSLARPGSLGVTGHSGTLSPPSIVLDTGVINDIEREARRLATDVDTMVESLSCMLQSMSALTVENVQTYRDGVCKTCDAVDSNIRAMYQLMAKWEELNKNMAPAYKVSGQIKDIKRLLDIFEAALV